MSFGWLLGGGHMVMCVNHLSHSPPTRLAALIIVIVFYDSFNLIRIRQIFHENKSLDIIDSSDGQ